MSVDVMFKEGNWPDATSRWAKDAEAALRESLGAPNTYEVVCLLTNDEDIRKLNAQFRGKDQATNVLSWPAVEYERDEEGRPRPLEPLDDSLGDLAFAYETCAREATEIGLENHFKHLTIHGILHLMGYDHISDKDAQIMEALEISTLSRLNISNPYEVREK